MGTSIGRLFSGRNFPEWEHWNYEKCRCECKQQIDKGRCDKEFIRKLSNCECKYDKLCHVGEYLDYENCKCRKKNVDKLIEGCSECS